MNASSILARTLPKGTSHHLPLSLLALSQFSFILHPISFHSRRLWLLYLALLCTRIASSSRIRSVFGPHFLGLLLYLMFLTDSFSAEETKHSIPDRQSSSRPVAHSHRRSDHHRHAREQEQRTKPSLDAVRANTAFEEVGLEKRTGQRTRWRRTKVGKQVRWPQTGQSSPARHTADVAATSSKGKQ